MKVTIIVEGDEDVRFLQDLIKQVFEIECVEKDFIKVLGNTSALEHVLEDIKKAIAFGSRPIAILDADGDYKKTVSSFSSWTKEKGLDIALFLFPSNHDSGNLETLLQQLIPENYRPLETCIDQYIDCVNKTGLTPPLDDKSKFFIYSQGAKGKDRQYLNEQWDFSSLALEPLVSFLKPYFEEAVEQ